MKLTPLFGSLGLSFALASPANAQWVDDFDSYLPGPLAAQSLWDEWTGSTGVDADVTSAYSFTPARSLKLVANNDVVWDFVNSTGGRPTSGKWAMSVKTFVPSGTTGSGWYIVLNEYPTPLKYSVQTEFNASTGMVNDSSFTATLKYDRWVSLVVAVDLDNNRYDSWYGEQPLVVNKAWASATGSTTIAVNDCYGGSNGLTGLYYDDDRLDKCSGGPLVLTTRPNPVGPNGTLNFYSNSPLLALGDLGMLFLWSVNGSPFPLGLLPASYDVNAEWRFAATVPPGLTGLELGFRMFALPAGGKIMLSNEDLVVMK